MLRPRLTYQPALDGLRTVAVGFVMLEHAVAYFVPEKYNRLFSGGWLGVDIFFVLSGFLITTLLLQEAQQHSTIRLGRFYLRRALRLFPALAAVLVVMSAYNLTHGESFNHVVRAVGSIAFYFVNWVKTFSYDVPPGLGHTWSLAVEEQFYLVWPLVILAGIRFGWRRRTWIGVLVAGIATSAILKGVLWIRSGDWEDVYYRTDARADALLMGALLAVLWTSGASLRAARFALLPAIALLVAVGTGIAGFNVPSGFFYKGGMTAIALAAAVVIACALDHSDARVPILVRVLALPPFQHIGRISYGLYLWHVPVFTIVAYNLHLPTAAMVLVGAGLSLLVAELSMVLIERPFLRLKDRAKPQSDMVSVPN